MKVDLSHVKEYGSLELLAKQLVDGFITGMHKSPYHGFSVEFAEHRLYNTGESTRHIDWKVFAKTDKLFTKRYEEETNLRCQLVIDHSASMHYPVKNKGKLAFSIISAASLAYLLQRQRDAVGITTFSDKIELQTQVKSTSSHLHELLNNLQALYNNPSTGESTSVASVLHEIAEKIHKRSLIIIFSDMLDKADDLPEIFGAMQHLKHNNHEVLLFHVTDKRTELDFDFDERPHEFIDLESGERIRVQPSEIKDNYTKLVSAYHRDLKLRCGQFKIDLVEADINDDYNAILNAYLIKRAKMK